MNKLNLKTQKQLAFWDAKYDAALAYMAECKDNPGVLIEVAAQHPLVNGLLPGEEFQARLNTAAGIYHYYRESCACKLYLPGGRHKVGDVEDQVTLSEAGITFLHTVCGIPMEDMLGHEDNMRVTNGAGVFNSDDECKVAAALFAEQRCGKLICVCSPGQMMRKALGYIKYGCLPDFHTVSVPNSHHRIPWEACVGIPRVVASGSAMTSEQRSDRIAT